MLICFPLALKWCTGGQQSAMDTTTSMKMTSLAIQSLFSNVEEENLAAIKAHLDKFKDVDSRSDVSQPLVCPSMKMLDWQHDSQHCPVEGWSKNQAQINKPTGQGHTRYNWRLLFVAHCYFKTPMLYFL